MINYFTFGQVSDFLLNDFRSFKFGSKTLSIGGKKVGHDGLSYLCFYLYHSLFCHCKSKKSTYVISPSCSWNSLTYFELLNLLPILITDIYEVLSLCPPSHVMVAYTLCLPHARFASFVQPSKENKDLVIKSYHRYIFDGEEYSTIDELREAVNDVYPSSKYNINLIIS